uniref:Ser1 n=1 Tax=Arundo donax TaxID=35708 RepID=A0A0A9H6P8_ARUDO
MVGKGLLLEERCPAEPGIDKFWASFIEETRL